MGERQSFALRRLLALILVGVMVVAEIKAGEPNHDKSPRTDEQNTGSDAESIRTAIRRGLPLLINASAREYPKHRACFSCHNQAVPALALAFARQRGFAVDAQTLVDISEHTEADLNEAIEDYRKGKGQPGSVLRAGYALWTLEAANWAPDETTAAVAHYVAAIVRERDHWLAQSRRPPSESSDFTATALALRSLQAYGQDPALKKAAGAAQNPTTAKQPQEEATARARALRWLKGAQPHETEDRVFRLWGLKHAGGSLEDLAGAVSALVRSQRSDGGWSQLDLPSARSKNEVNDKTGAAGAGPEAAFVSDAYATGSALVALHQAGGMAAVDPVYRRGLNFLIGSQRDDGSWFVKSRSHPFQTYFESGFPHGPNQFISAAASAWAIAALALACPAP